MIGRVNGVLTVVLLTSVAIALSGCGGSASKGSSPDQQALTSASAEDISTCLMQSDVASLVTDVSYELDQLDNSTVLMIKTTIAPGQYDGADGANAVGYVAQVDCGATGAIAIIDRDGNDMGAQAQG
jgi:hypothetical protein